MEDLEVDGGGCGGSAEPDGNLTRNEAQSEVRRREPFQYFSYHGYFSHDARITAFAENIRTNGGPHGAWCGTSTDLRAPVEDVEAEQSRDLRLRSRTFENRAAGHANVSQMCPMKRGAAERIATSLQVDALKIPSGRGCREGGI